MLPRYTNLNEPTWGTFVDPSAVEEISNQISIKPDRKAAIDMRILLFAISLACWSVCWCRNRLFAAKSEI